MTTLAWHFVGDTLRDGRPVPADLEWLEHKGTVEICESGLHASRNLFDALQYAPGSTICRVAVDTVCNEEADKLVARRRVILWRVKANQLLGDFARQMALSVIHLWDAPEVVKQYLETGNKTLRDDAWAAARAAAGAAAGAAADAAVWAAARAAARAAAGDAARDAAREAAWDAAGAAARAAAREAAWDAAWAAARAAAHTKLEEMVRKAAGNPDDSELLARVK